MPLLILATKSPQHTGADRLSQQRYVLDEMTLLGQPEECRVITGVVVVEMLLDLIEQQQVA